MRMTQRKMMKLLLRITHPENSRLVQSTYGLRLFAKDMGYHGKPFRWDEVRRAQLRAELDAYYARVAPGADAGV